MTKLPIFKIEIMPKTFPLFTISVFVLALFLGCAKERPEQAEISYTTAYAGDHDGSYFYHAPSNPIGLTPVYDSQNFYGFAEDSFDIDNDCLSDFIFSIKTINMDSAHLIGPLTTRPYCALQALNQYQTVLKYTQFNNIGSQTYTTASIEAIPLNHPIDLEARWLNQGNSNAIRFYRDSVFVPGPAANNGAWFALNEVRYVGIKKNNLFGWIEIDMTDRKNPKIIRWARQM